MLISLAVMIFYNLVLPAQDIRVHRRLPSALMIEPIINKDVRSLSTENLTINDNSWDSRGEDFEVFLLPVSVLKPFIILREPEDKIVDSIGDQENNMMFMAEQLKPQIDLNKMQYFSKSRRMRRASA